MASISQPFPHPGVPMAGHGGMAPGAHPMASGHPPNQGMPGGQPGMMGQQMHGMGGPQVSSGPMMSMGQGGPGMGAPNAHAMSHLNPNNIMGHNTHAMSQQQLGQSKSYLPS